MDDKELIAAAEADIAAEFGEDSETEDLEYMQDAREAEPDAARQAAVTRDIEMIKHARDHWSDKYDNIRKWQKYARHGCDPDEWDEHQVVVPIVQRVVRQKVSALYAKNPKFKASPRQRLLSTVWDGTPETLNQAMQEIQMAAQSGMPPPQEWLDIIQDAARADQRRSDIRLVGRSMELAMDYYLDELNFKQRFKGAVRRAVVSSFAPVKLGYQRSYEVAPEFSQRLMDAREEMASLERLMREAEEGEWTEHDAQADELRNRIAKLEEEQIMREGLVIDFPRATSIIPSTDMTNLKGLEGCSWVAQEFLMTPERIEEVYGVKMSAQARRYKATDFGVREVEIAKDQQRRDGLYVHRVFEMWDIKAGQKRTVCEGHNDYLDNPEEETLHFERGHPFVILTLLDVEDEEDPWPNSYVGLMMDLQAEYNRSRDSLRSHRYHALPKYFVKKGKMSEEDKIALASGRPFRVYEIDGLEEGDKIQDVIQSFTGSGVDPNVHSEAQILDDMTRIGASTETAMGAVAGRGSATEASIAEDTYASATSSDIDEIDETLSEIARVCGGLMLTEMDADTIREIVGPGALWVETITADGQDTMTREDASKSIFLSVRAGSSGKPNASKTLAKLERAFPAVSQLQGLNPRWLAERYLEALDPGFDLEEAFVPDGLSIMARNAIMQTSMGLAQTAQDQASPVDQAMAAQAGAAGGNNPGAPGPAPGGREMPVDVQNNQARMG